MSRLLGKQVDAVQAGAVVETDVVGVLWAVAVNARLIATVLAGEDTTIFLAIERLEETGAAFHADEAGFELLGISECD